MSFDGTPPPSPDIVLGGGRGAGPGPTAEQQEAISLFGTARGNSVIVVPAGPGSGKTFTVEAAAKVRCATTPLFAPIAIVYFNVAMRADAQARIEALGPRYSPKISCFTMHALARLYYEETYNRELMVVEKRQFVRNHPGTEKIMQWLDPRNRECRDALLREMDEDCLWHWQCFSVPPEERTKRRAPSGMVEVYSATHDMYMEVFVSRPERAAAWLSRTFSAFVLDEAQDTNADFARVLELLEIPLYVTGDPYQAIYGFRNTVNFLGALAERRSVSSGFDGGKDDVCDDDAFEGRQVHVKRLTQTFRFPECVSRHLRIHMETVGRSLSRFFSTFRASPPRGRAGVPGAVVPWTRFDVRKFPREVQTIAVVSFTRRGLLEKLMQLERRWPGLVAIDRSEEANGLHVGLDKTMRELSRRFGRDRQNAPPPDNFSDKEVSLLRIGKDNWASFARFKKVFDDMYSRGGERDVPSFTPISVSPVTVHSCKGLEYDGVILAEDIFHFPVKEVDKACIAYTAITRVRNTLVLAFSHEKFVRDEPDIKKFFARDQDVTEVHAVSPTPVLKKS